MDWSRAKTILIIAFIILDLFLGAQLSQTMQQKSQFVKEQVMIPINKLLNQKHIKRPQTPHVPKQLDKATVSPMKGNWKKDERGGYVKEFSPPLLFRNQQELLRILKEQIPFFDQYRYIPSLSTSNQQIYLQQAGNYLVFDGNIIVHLSDSHRLASIRIIHFQLSKVSHVKLVSFDTALYRLVTGWNKSNYTIAQATLGYQSIAYPTDGEDYYLLIPAWHFQVGKDHLLVNATNNGLNEGVEVTPMLQQIENKGTK
jgi:regulatory protein YycI of two-component signal transduction system YycFG